MSRLPKTTPTLLGLSLLCCATSCSLAIDVELDCARDIDCADRNTDDALYACVSGTCEAAMCEEDSDCGALGDTGFALCESGACVSAACVEDEDCEGQLDTPGEAVCQEGRCEDLQWGCIGRKDPRTPEGDRASFKLPLVDLLMQPPVKVEVAACLTPDASCQSPRSISVDYDATTGVLEISGKELQGFGGYLRIRSWFTDTIEYMESRFQFTTRDLVNDVENEETAIMVLASLVPMLGERGGIENAEASRGIILIRVYDCQGNPAEGVTLVSSDSGLADDSVIFYVVNEEYELSNDLGATTAVGVVGVANILKQSGTVDYSINLEAYLDDTLIVPPFTAVMDEGGVTHAWVYPGYE